MTWGYISKEQYRNIARDFRQTCLDLENELFGLIDDTNKVDFNYPECLDRIVDAGMKAAEAKILEFKKMDEHDEMMSRINTPEDNIQLHGYGGSYQSPFGAGGGGDGRYQGGGRW